MVSTLLAMAAKSKVLAAWQAVRNVSRIQGDIVEAGVFRGGTSMVMAWAEMQARDVFFMKPCVSRAF